MRFDWSEYLQLAEEIGQDAEQSELEQARRGCAISRAYYAAFCSARDLLESRGDYSAFGDGRDHEGVARTFDRAPSVERQRVGQELYRLKDHRTKADYDGDVVFPNELVQSILARSRRLIDRLQRV